MLCPLDSQLYSGTGSVNMMEQGPAVLASTQTLKKGNSDDFQTGVSTQCR